MKAPTTRKTKAGKESKEKDFEEYDLYLDQNHILYEKEKLAREWFDMYQAGVIDAKRFKELIQQLGPGWGVLDSSGTDYYHSAVYVNSDLKQKKKRKLKKKS